jgi:hypothetical protein
VRNLNLPISLNIEISPFGRNDKEAVRNDKEAVRNDIGAVRNGTGAFRNGIGAVQNDKNRDCDTASQAGEVFLL